MRKLEEEQFKTKAEWVQFHKFPEDTLADWYEQKGIKSSRQNDPYFIKDRCSCCNYSPVGLHDETLVSLSGRKKKRRRMIRVDDYYVCEYCHNTDQQHYELEKKKELYVNDKDVHALANLLRKEDLELLV